MSAHDLSVPAGSDGAVLTARANAVQDEAAQLVGFDNFAEYSLASKMAGSVADVMVFLEELADRSHAAAEHELQELERFAGQALAASPVQNSHWSAGET